MRAVLSVSSGCPSRPEYSAPSNWRFKRGQLFNGVAAFDASASLTYTAASDGEITLWMLGMGGLVVRRRQRRH